MKFNLKTICNAFTSILVRFIFIIQIGFSIYFLTDYLDQYAYLSLMLCCLAIIADCIYVVLARKGLEYKWCLNNIKLKTF